MDEVISSRARTLLVKRSKIFFRASFVPFSPSRKSIQTAAITETPHDPPPEEGIEKTTASSLA